MILKETYYPRQNPVAPVRLTYTVTTKAYLLQRSLMQIIMDSFMKDLKIPELMAMHTLVHGLLVNNIM